MTLLIVADGTHRSGGDGKQTVSGDGHKRCGSQPMALPQERGERHNPEETNTTRGVVGGVVSQVQCSDRKRDLSYVPSGATIPARHFSVMPKAPSNDRFRGSSGLECSLRPPASVSIGQMPLVHLNQTC